MKQIYKSIDGQIFDKEKDCLVHEFNLKGGSENFKSTVKAAVDEVKKLTGLDIKIKEVDANIEWDGDPNSDIMRFIERQEVHLIVYKDGVQRGEEYNRGSDGNYYTKENLIEELIKEYHTPYLKIHEGIIGESNEGEWCPEGYAIDGINVNDILKSNYGKRIRIEILE
ncbi:hypothetical protein [Robertmurraya siralis]|uniref:hypothetical protein n=1 Tax=Robertmurraya siralis TaxID=77777 RepID=UPI0010F55834|nr:hypothetical protein [Robertmurraya siralis]